MSWRRASTSVSAATLVLLAWTAGAAPRRESLIYSRFDIDPGEWRYFEFPAKENLARLEVRFEVLSPQEASGVRVRIFTAAEFQQLRAQEPHRELHATEYRRQGRLRARLGDAGGYAVVIDNPRTEREKSRVELDVMLATGPDPKDLPVAYASPRKRVAVVGLSLIIFLAIVGWSGRALLRAARQRPEPPPPPFTPIWS